ncbi:MAG: MBOAT family protein [Armatimonadetes bacterium]|nr:MBOAT family protein [Armatimonadota bacterium]
MVFSSYIFVFYFLPLALVLYYLWPWMAVRHVFLTLLSYIFYGWVNPFFVPLMLVSTLIDYIAGLVQAYDGFRGWNGPTPMLEAGAPRTRTQKAALVVSLCLNLGLLGFFKYFNFAAENFHALAQWMGVSQSEMNGALRVTLPLGISFYTFQSMSYSIDVYRGQARAMRSLLNYACFVSMFQQLVAGPIVRFSEIADQLRARSHSQDKFARGVALFSLGLGMKVLLANPCGKIADTVWNAASSRPLEAWFGLLAYSFQIYFDFAGYSEMAIGLGLMMGFVFAKNFETPYQADSITDFWRRWHISLSTWLRDYLYVPLGGNRRGEARTYINLMLTMLLGGLWHGASWNFLIWGGIHGSMLAFERHQKTNGFFGRWPRAVRVGLTFLVVMLSWTFFRAPDLPSALNYWGRLFALTPAQPGADLLSGVVYQPYYLFSIALAALVAWQSPTVWAWTQRLTWPKAAFCLGTLWLSLVVLLTQTYNPFIYFIF